MTSLDTSTTTASSTEPFVIDNLKWNEQGLIPAIAQDASSGTVLMVAWMNKDALQLTLNEGKVVYWSRSRQQLWRKGESSGHSQILVELKIDCDDDVILMSVEQQGGIACHTGRESCFFRTYKDGKLTTTSEVIKSPDEIYSK